MLLVLVQKFYVNVNLNELFISDVNIKYMLFSILYGHINVPMAFKELSTYEDTPGISKGVRSLYSGWFLNPTCKNSMPSNTWTVDTHMCGPE